MRCALRARGRRTPSTAGRSPSLKEGGWGKGARQAQAWNRAYIVHTYPNPSFISAISQVSTTLTSFEGRGIPKPFSIKCRFSSKYNSHCVRRAWQTPRSLVRLPYLASILRFVPLRSKGKANPSLCSSTSSPLCNSSLRSKPPTQSPPKGRTDFRKFCPSSEAKN